MNPLFASLSAAGLALADRLSDYQGVPDTVVLGILPGGAPVALEVARALALPVLAAQVDRTDPQAPLVGLTGEVSGRTVIVVDDAVESGLASRAVGLALGTQDVVGRVLAVPVCPRVSEPLLYGAYDVVVALARPDERAPLASYYGVLDIPTVADGRAMLAAWPDPR